MLGNARVAPRSRTAAAALALILLFVLAVFGAGCDRGDAQARELTAPPSVTATAPDREPARSPLREGRALRRIDRLMSAPLGANLN